MRHLTILLILILLLSACGKPAGLDADAPQEEVEDTPKEETKEDTEEKEESKDEKEEETEESDEEEETEEEEEGVIKTDEDDDRIDITTKNGKGYVKGIVNGVEHEFDTDYDDLDALIFDAAQKWDMSLFETRYIVWLNGNRHLRPSEEKAAEEAISKLEDPNLDTSGIAYLQTKEEGFLRGVGCDRDKGILTLRIFNEDENDVPMWRDVKPRIKGALVFRLNKKILDTMYCEGKETLEAGEEYRCRKSGLLFVEDKQTSTIRDDSDYGDIQNEVVVSKPGVTEIMKFNCPLEQPEVEVEEEDNSTNSTA